MSKVKDLALKMYPVVMTTLIPADEDHPLIEQDCNKFIREAYIKGYEQAEKDLELTWKDMMIIHKCIKDAMNFHLYKMMEGLDGQKIVYQEVLKRFNKERKEK